MKRRGFLKLLATSPVAAPVAAKEAAVSMGLAGPLGGGAELGLAGSTLKNNWAPTPETASAGEWLSFRMKDFFSQESKEQRLREAKHNSRRLDADIAAMRSVSPAAAYNMQVARALAVLESERLSYLQREAKEAGIPWIW